MARLVAATTAFVARRWWWWCAIIMTESLFARAGPLGHDAAASSSAPVVVLTQAPIPAGSLPYPWQEGGSMALVGASGDGAFSPSSSCQASMYARSQRACGARTAWLATTTVGLAVDCLGCEQLATVRTAAGGCPLGGTHRQDRDAATVPATRSIFSFYCAPTPALPLSTTTYKDATIALPVPTLPAGLADLPAWTPVAMTAYTYAEGWCWNELELGAAAADVAALCDAQRRQKTVFATTATRTVQIDCPVCDQGIDAVTGQACPTAAAVDPQENKEKQGTSAPAVTATGVTTTWTYQCLPKPTRN